jgi:alkylation response protein AidB-like acyl-CoA dehydrogenase
MRRRFVADEQLQTRCKSSFRCGNATTLRGGWRSSGRPATIGFGEGRPHEAHLVVELELARSAVLKALPPIDEAPEKAGPTASMAKAKAGQVAKLAAQEAVQMHGGMGMTDDLDISLFVKRIRVAQELLGDVQFHTDRLARLRGY